MFQHSHIEEICRGPDVDSPEFATEELALKEVERRKRAVGAVSDPNTATAKEKCLSLLEDSKSGVKSFFGE